MQRTFISFKSSFVVLEDAGGSWLGFSIFILICIWSGTLRGSSLKFWSHSDLWKLRYRQFFKIQESSRSFYDRIREHVEALRDKNKSYAITKHWLNSHKDLENPPNYKYQIVGSHLTAIQRQITEGLTIESFDPDHLINGKGEYGSNKIPRFKMTVDGEMESEPKKEEQKSSHV